MAQVIYPQWRPFLVPWNKFYTTMEIVPVPLVPTCATKWVYKNVNYWTKITEYNVPCRDFHQNPSLPSSLGLQVSHGFKLTACCYLLSRDEHFNSEQHQIGWEQYEAVLVLVLFCHAATQQSNYTRNAYKWCAVIGLPGSARPNLTALPQWTLDLKIYANANIQTKKEYAQHTSTNTQQ